MMECRQALSLLPGDLAGENPQSIALQIAEHLKKCRSCSIVYESARETVMRVNGEGFGNGPVA